MLVSLLACAAAQPLEARFAPDQPAPLVFADDPFVIEYTLHDRIARAAELYVELPDGNAWRASGDALGIGDAPLGSAFWRSVPGLPVVLGPHAVTLSTSVAGNKVSYTGRFVRIRRPDPDRPSRISIAVSDWNRPLRYAVQCLPAHAVRFDALEPEMGANVKETRAVLGSRVYIRVRASDVATGLSLEALAASIGPDVALWEIEGAADAADFSALARVIQAQRPDARVAAVVREPEEVTTLLREDANVFPSAWVCDVAQGGVEIVDQVTQAAERAGFEGIPVVVNLDLSATGGEGRSVLQNVLPYWTPLVETVFVDQKDIAVDGAYRNAFPALVHLGDALFHAAPMGPLLVDASPGVWLFRPAPGDSGADWILAAGNLSSDLAFASTPGTASDLSVTYFDIYGNDVSFDSRRPDGVFLSQTGDALFAAGQGGEVLRRYAVESVRARARRVLANEAWAGEAPPEAAIALKALAEYTYPDSVRFQLFALLRSLPPIEEAWHRGLTTSQTAVPLMRAMVDIASALAYLEEDIGEPFLEPLDKTLNTCRTLLERYGTPEEPGRVRAARVQFLQAEVERLMSEAQAWNDAGRVTESKAVAAIAEWRARCLEPVCLAPAYVADAEEASGDESDANGNPGDAQEGP